MGNHRTNPNPSSCYLALLFLTSFLLPVTRTMQHSENGAMERQAANDEVKEGSPSKDAKGETPPTPSPELLKQKEIHKRVQGKQHMDQIRAGQRLLSKVTSAQSLITSKEAQNIQKLAQAMKDRFLLLHGHRSHHFHQPHRTSPQQNHYAHHLPAATSTDVQPQDAKSGGPVTTHPHHKHYHRSHRAHQQHHSYHNQNTPSRHYLTLLDQFPLARPMRTAWGDAVSYVPGTVAGGSAQVPVQRNVYHDDGPDAKSGLNHFEHQEYHHYTGHDHLEKEYADTQQEYDSYNHESEHVLAATDEGGNDLNEYTGNYQHKEEYKEYATELTNETPESGSSHREHEQNAKVYIIKTGRAEDQPDSNTKVHGISREDASSRQQKGNIEKEYKHIHSEHQHSHSYTRGSKDRHLQDVHTRRDSYLQANNSGVSHSHQSHKEYRAHQRNTGNHYPHQRPHRATTDQSGHRHRVVHPPRLSGPVPFRETRLRGIHAKQGPDVEIFEDPALNEFSQPPVNEDIGPVQVVDNRQPQPENLFPAELGNSLFKTIRIEITPASPPRSDLKAPAILNNIQPKELPEPGRKASSPTTSVEIALTIPKPRKKPSDESPQSSIRERNDISSSQVEYFQTFDEREGMENFEKSSPVVRKIHPTHTDQFLQEQHVYHGIFTGKCTNDGMYYRTPQSFVICSHGYEYVQPCATGSQNSHVEEYREGRRYNYHDFCDVNMLGSGYPNQLSRNSGREKKSQRRKSVRTPTSANYLFPPRF